MTFELLNSETVFHGKVFDLRIDTLRGPSGSPQRVDVVKHPGAVVLVPLDADRRIWLVRQYRHPAGENLLELPAGTLEADESIETCAVRELREEIGMAPAQLIHLGGTFMAPGYSTEYLDFFLAQDLTPSPLRPDPDEVIHVELLTLEEIRQQVAQKAIRDAKTLAGIFLALPYLQEDL